MHAHMPPYTKQQPTGAYRSSEPQAAPEMPESERKLRTALAYVNHARDLILAALDQPTSCNGQNQPTSCEPERVPKWDPRWSLPPGGSTAAMPKQDGEFLWNGPLPPNCDGPSARDVRAPHPMQAETIRDHDERLAGGESQL